MRIAGPLPHVGAGVTEVLPQAQNPRIAMLKEINPWINSTKQMRIDSPFLTNFIEVLRRATLMSSCPTTFRYLPQSQTVPFK